MATLTINQQQLFENVRGESKKRARDIIRRAKLKKGQRQKIVAAKRKLGKAPLVLNIDLREQYRDEQVIDGLLDVGRVLNAIEVGAFPGGIYDRRFRARLLNEFKIYGATRSVQVIFSHLHDWERPNYGILDYLNKPTSIAPSGYYGHYRFVLKQELKERSTFTPFDSFGVEREHVYVFADIEGVLSTRLDGRLWYEYVLEEKEPIVTGEGVHYIEAQILGGVRLADVERLYYPAADRVNRVFFAKIKRLELDYGIELVHYGR